MEQHPVARYGSVAQFFHWTTVAFVLAAFYFGPGGSEQRIYAPAADFDRQLHETLGMCVFALAVLRILWLTVDTRPDPPQVPRWMTVAAKAVQWGFYLLLIALPLTAISGAWLEGHPLTFLGGLKIAPLVGLSHDVGAKIATIHTWLGDTILWLAGFHALAGLFHHMVIKDEVLLSMLPRWIRLRQMKP